MVDNIITKPLGLFLFVAAHMVFNGPSQAEVTGILGTNITLQFTFKVNITKNNRFSVYKGSSKKKIAEYSQKEEDCFGIYPKNKSVFYRITNLKLNDSGLYSVGGFFDTGPVQESTNVELIVREENRSSTVSPMTISITITTSGSPASLSSHIVTVLVVLPVVLLAAVLLGLIWCLVRTKDEQQLPPQQNSNATIQEIVEASNSVPASSLVYSVLDFPKRASAGLEMNPNDTEYAAVSYLTEKRRM